jgi:hypothetical protein
MKRTMNVPGVNLNNTVFLGHGVKCILNVTLADNTEMPDDLDSSATKHVVFVIRESLRRCDHDRITSVSTQRIEVLHIAADDRVLERAHALNFRKHDKAEINAHQRHHGQLHIRVPSSPSYYAQSKPEGTNLNSSQRDHEVHRGCWQNQNRDHQE